MLTTALQARPAARLSTVARAGGRPAKQPAKPVKPAQKKAAGKAGKTTPKKDGAGVDNAGEPASPPLPPPAPAPLDLRPPAPCGASATP